MSWYQSARITVGAPDPRTLLLYRASEHGHRARDCDHDAEVALDARDFPRWVEQRKRAALHRRVEAEIRGSVRQ